MTDPPPQARSAQDGTDVPAYRRALAFVADDGVLWVLFFAALAVRLHWNLEVHPPGEYIYSDMRGYMDRADGIFENRWGIREYNAFYPYGTHVLLHGIQVVVGRGNHPAIATVFAFLGAALVSYGYVLARNVSRHRVVHLAVGCLLVCYYPLISLGGYFLSEVPFSLCLTAASVHLLRLVRHGSRLDAWLMGLFVAMGFTLRPQILASCALVGVMWLLLRRRMPKLTVSLWAQALVPILLIMAFSSWRLHHHTERYGLISENGKFNQVYGRCHVMKITALPDRAPRRRTSFGPPAMIQLAKRAQRAPGSWPQLDPAIGLEFEYRGYIGDDEILGEYIGECVEARGWFKQVEYAVVDVLLLWRFNVMWPDSGKGAWQPYARKWGHFVSNVLAIPATLAMFALFMPRRFAALGLVSTHLWALTTVAALYLGGARFRAPYDPIIIVMAAEAYAVAFAVVVAGVRWLRERRRRANPAAS